MEKETITKAAELLKQASSMLLSIDQNPAGDVQTNANSRSNHSNQTRAVGPGTSNTVYNSRSSGAAATVVPELRETLQRARSMMAASSNAGLYRRMNRNERLRAASGKSPSTSNESSKNKKEKTARSLEKKPFEFALLRANEEDSDDEEDDTLRKDIVMSRGMVTLNDSDTEKLIRDKLVSSLKPKYPMLEKSDFEFVKVIHKKITVLQLDKNTEYNYSVVKKLAGQGLLYIRMRKALQCIVSGEFQEVTDSLPFPEIPPPLRPLSPIPQVTLEPTTQQPGTPAAQPVAPTMPATQLPSFFSTVIKEIPPNVTDPTEMLQYLQKKVLLGRDLDVSDESSQLSGDTNYISVDRDNILKTTFEELKDIADPRVTFEVQFYGEEAQDSGGPRREWIRLCNQQIQMKYFEHGLKDHLASDYYFVGQMAAIALLQNGQLPVYFPESVLQDIFTGPSPSPSPCISNIQKGLDTLGIHTVGQQYPQFLHLLRPSAKANLTVKMLLHLLKPRFSVEGSNNMKFEKNVYAHFIKYVREVASGRRVTSLENILEFVTGASEEPLLGFTILPSVEFVEATCGYRQPASDDGDEEGTTEKENEPEKKKQIYADFLPKSHTCTNTLKLPRETHSLHLPSEDALFNLYDYSFLNSCFGVV